MEFLMANLAHVERFKAMREAEDERMRRAPLHRAVSRRDVAEMRRLLDEGADIHVVDLCGLTPLHVAIERFDRTAVQLLLERGADPNFRAWSPYPLHKGWTPLHMAAIRGDVGIIEMLLTAGADTNDNRALEDGVTWTPLRLALRQLAGFESMRDNADCFLFDEDIGEDTPITFEEAVVPYREVVKLLRQSGGEE
jgi:ankyrin repeat protein